MIYLLCIMFLASPSVTEIPRQKSQIETVLRIRRKSIIKMPLECTDGEIRPHYFIVLSLDLNTGIGYFVLMGSHHEFIDSHDKFKKKFVVTIPIGELSFGRVESVVNCNNLRRYDLFQIKEFIRSGELEYIEQLPNRYFDQIKSKVLNLPFLTRQQRRVLPRLKQDELLLNSK